MKFIDATYVEEIGFESTPHVVIRPPKKVKYSSKILE